MDFLLALILVIAAWVLFKSLVVALLVLVCVLVAIAIVRGGNRRL